MKSTEGGHKSFPTETLESKIEVMSITELKEISYHSLKKPTKNQRRSTPTKFSPKHVPCSNVLVELHSP